MDNDYTIGLPTWECDVHGRHSAILNVRAVSVERKQERRYCVFCIMDRLDASGMKEMRDIDALQPGERIRPPAPGVSND